MSSRQRFGFNRSTPALFVADLLKQVLLLLALGTPLALAALWLMQGAGTLWWFYLWLLWSGFTLLMLWAYPAVIAPLFNKFTPLKNSRVQKRIQSLLKRTGFRSRGIYVMDGSRRSAHGNAYFTGFGRNKRVVFFDTLLKTLRGPEIEAVLAHELGHFHHRHIIKRIVMLFGMSLTGLALLGWLIQQHWFYQGLGVSTASAHAALILFLMAGPVFTFFLQPIMAWGSRRHEYQADAYAADQAEHQADDQRAGQTIPRECQHPDTGPGVFGVLRFASTGIVAHRAFAVTGITTTASPGEIEMNKSTLLLAVLTLGTSSSAVATLLPGDAAKGKAVHDKQCVACHDSSVYTRANRRVKSPEALNRTGEWLCAPDWREAGSRPDQ